MGLLSEGWLEEIYSAQACWWRTPTREEP